MSHQHSSPPLPNLHALSISPTPYGVHSDYPYNGVFGPPVPTPTGGQPARGWTSSPKRGSRSGIPQAWFEPHTRESSSLSHESFRRDNSSPAALSPPSSAASVTPGGQPFYPGFALDAFPSMGLAPSPPPQQMPYGINTGGLGSAGGYGSAGLTPFSAGPLSGIGQRPNQPWQRGVPAPSMPMPDDDVIPTAIVIKNIPFAVSRETLLAIIESLGAPLPYAFNYHHDNGVFRGLAFANFRAPDEAASVVAALNGYDVQGRKLRVEYKKVLQPGEKDRIEREKAIKRMKSMQIDAAVKTPIEMPGQSPLILHSARSVTSTGGPNNGHHPSFSFDNADDRSPPTSAGSGHSDSLPNQLDLNDPNSLRIYNMVYMFKEDRMRDELVLSRNLSATERRIVHLVAQKLDLTSVTQGDHDGKHVVVTKDAPPRSAHTPLSTSYLSPYPSDLPAPSLRSKKSMPDLRGFNGPVVARDPARSLTPQRSSGNLRAEAADGVIAGRDYASMGAAHGRRLNGHGIGSGNFNSFFGAPVGAPPMPPLPHTLSDGPGDAGSQPLRNPRGPVGESRGFGGMLRPVSSSLRGVPGALALGRCLSEEDELENARTREELDL